MVKDRLNELRVEKYGAAELSEATAQMQWQALDQARAMIYDAPYNVRSRFIMAILSKTMSADGPPVAGDGLATCAGICSTSCIR